MTTKIAHIIIGLNLGGAELMLKRLVILSNQNESFEHIVISLTDLGVIGPELQKAGITVYSLDIKSASSLPVQLYQLRKLLKKAQPDVVQTWMYHADLLGGLVAKSLGVNRIVWGIRNTGVNNELGISRRVIRSLCARLSYRIPSTIICVAQEAKETHASIGYDQTKMSVIPNGFDVHRFYPDEDKRQATRLKLDISNDDLVIGNIGRFVPEKNHVNFIKACIQLLDKGLKFKVLLAGREVDLDNTAIAALFQNNSYRPYFIFMGQIIDTPSFYNAIDIFCLSSISEGFPNVLGEAMATGKVCLATDAGDAYYILDEHGYQIKSTKDTDIAEALKASIMDSTTKEFDTMAQRARTSILQRFSLKKIVADFEQLYV